MYASENDGIFLKHIWVSGEPTAHARYGKRVIT
jgi:hypothetical protein